MKTLTPKQKNILSFIKEFIQTNRYAPSYREIQHNFGFESIGSVHKYIDVLKKKGALATEKYAARSLSLTEDSSKAEEVEGVDIPFIGTIEGGQPIETFAQAQTVKIPKHYIHAINQSYVLRVKGETLLEEWMCEGDLLVVEARQEAHPGEMIIGLINQHDTIVKRYYPDHAYVKLIASNPHVHPIILYTDDLQIQGVVVSLFRRY